jgi:hypothetical protein
MNPLRWPKLFTLILLLGVMAAVVTAAEQKTPNLTLTSPGAIEPAAVYAEAAPGENAGTEPSSKVNLQERYTPGAAGAGIRTSHSTATAATTSTTIYWM